MILKKRDDKAAKNKLEIAGENAEKQMIFYLERAFGDSENKDVIVLNDLRIEDTQGNIAQMDHLLIHPYGFVIIESKSVHGSVAINENGEWVRIYNRQKKGMRSPIKQAQMQKEVLVSVLEENKNKLFKQTMVNKLFKTSFHDYAFDVVVAISDSGVIERPQKYDTSMVVKADMVCDYVKDLIRKYEKKSKSLISMDIPSSFYASTIMVIAAFLQSKHKPLFSQSEIQDRVEEEKVVYGYRTLGSKRDEERPQNNKFVCRKCKSDHLNIEYGYSYYFKCRECDGNTPIRLKCKNEQCVTKLKKEKDRFYQVCETCHTKTLYFINNKF